MQLKTISIQDTKQQYLFYLLKLITMKADTSMKKKKERSHIILNRKKVAIAVAKNPTGTTREIAKAAWVSHETVNVKLWQLWQVKEKWLEETLSRDKEIIKLGQEIICEDLIEELEIIKHNKENPEYRKKRIIWAWAVSWIIKENTARYTLFRWEATDEQGGIKDMTNVWTKELEERIKHLLNL